MNFLFKKIVFLDYYVQYYVYECCRVNFKKELNGCDCEIDIVIFRFFFFQELFKISEVLYIILRV